MNKTVKIIFNTILIVLIAILALYAILRFTNKIEILRVQTGSMEDGIHAGDYILIYKNGDYTVDDIVTFEKDGYYITHRIIEENGDKVITKGDANNTEDEEISKKDIVGRVIFSGGILNFVVNYKYIIVITLLLLYTATYLIDKSIIKVKK